MSQRGVKTTGLIRSFMKFHFPVFQLLVLFIFLTVSGRAADDYTLGPDSEFNPKVPQGEVTKHRWENSRIFPGTVRDWWVYVPKQYDSDKPAPVMVFQDGGNYVNTNGAWRVPYVFDNLIARKELPPLIGVFINPGQSPAAKPGDTAKNRSVECDP